MQMTSDYDIQVRNRKGTT